MHIYSLLRFYFLYSCKECEDYLCEPCKQAHLKVKLTKNHSINAIKLCSNCENENTVASYHCKECEDYLCQTCHHAHLTVKLTRNHSLIPLT